MAVFLGLNAKLYYQASGYSADAGNGNKPDLTGGVGTEVTIAQDVTLNLEKAETDVSTRGNNGFRARVGTLKDGSAEFQIIWDTGDAVFGDLFDAWYNNTVIGFAILDEAYNAGYAGTGLVGNFDILNFSRPEPLEEALVAQITIALTQSSTVPGFLELGTLL